MLGWSHTSMAAMATRDGDADSLSLASSTARLVLINTRAPASVLLHQ